MNKNGAKWMLVFNHDLRANKKYFADANSALYCEDENMFSILYKIDKFSMINGKYEFILEYPPLTEYIQWTQDLNPITTYEDNTQASELNVNIKHEGFQNFRGLMRSNVEMSLLDGDNKEVGFYFYSVGTVRYGNNNTPPAHTLMSYNANYGFASLQI